MVKDFHDIMALAIEGSGTGIWDRDIVSGEIRYSRGWLEILGFRPGEISVKVEDAEARVHPDDRAYVLAAMEAHFEGRTPGYVVEHRLRCRDGSYKWVQSRGRVISRDAQGRALRMVGTTADITSTRVLADRLQQSHDLLTNLTNQVPGLVFQSRRAPDGTAHMTYASSRIREILELTPAQVAVSTAPIHARIHPDDRDLYTETLDAATHDVMPWHCVFRVLLPVRGLRWRRVDAHPTLLPGGDMLWHGLIMDATEGMRLQQQLQDLARVDHLSGLSNRRAFIEHLEAARATLDCHPDRISAVMMIDIDHFKSINDRYGHAAGDAVIREVSEILRSSLRSGDSAGRMGGEEFAVCLQDVAPGRAERIAERLRGAIADTPIPFDDFSISLTVSIGVSEIRATDTDGDEVLTRADMALYAAKKGGRNRVVFAMAGDEEGEGEPAPAAHSREVSPIPFIHRTN